MEEKGEKKTQTDKILNYFGKAYLRIPRIILNWLFAADKNEQVLGRLYCTLFVHCYYTDGIVKIRGQEFVEVKGVSNQTCFIVCGYRQYMEANARPEWEAEKKSSLKAEESARLRLEGEQRISRGHVFLSSSLNHSYSDIDLSC